ncbi:MAG TPA: hypothetical protein QF401_04065 [Candidatus Poseidoniaceae archaeon]|nr:hypothetical protein [Candidatus Poseidoniaceae archaeon]
MMEILLEHAPSFRLGDEENWLIEQRYLLDGELIDDTKLRRECHHLEDSRPPLIVKKQRRGWYLTPNPIHSVVRNYISKTVIVLLVALGYLFVEPILSSFGIPGIGTGTIRIGLLDYPLLAIVIVPLLFSPLALRVGANLADLIQQRNFLKSSPEPPIIEIIGQPSAGEPLKIRIDFPVIRDDWSGIQITWRVGALPPAREELFRALERGQSMQPPPGLTTELPHHWEIGLDDGTGGGEEAPMEHQEVQGGLFLRPMRVMEFGGRSDINDGEILLQAPKLNWPGTVSTELIRIHWEIIVSIQRPKGGPLLWVRPLAVSHPQESSNIVVLPTNDGRTESDSV